MIQLPVTWQQYYWVLDLARVNKIPVLQRENGWDGSTLRKMDGKGNASIGYYCYVTWSNSEHALVFDWRYATNYVGFASHFDSDWHGWNFSVAKNGYFWHQAHLVGESRWRKRVSTIAQVCGICERINNETRHRGMTCRWNQERYFRRCDSIAFSFFPDNRAPFVFEVRICEEDNSEGYTLTCETEGGQFAQTFKKVDEFIDAMPSFQ